MKLNLTTGLVPNLNVSAALLAFVFLRTWTKLLSKAGIVTNPFTRQENTIVQTCVVACYSIIVGGGFGSYLLGLNRKTYEQAGVDTEGNTPGSTKEPGIGWMTGFLFVSSFVGLLALVPLRKFSSMGSTLLQEQCFLGDYNFVWGQGLLESDSCPTICNETAAACIALLFQIQDKEQVLDDQKRNEVFAGKNNGVVAGLVGCGLIKSIVSISSDLMHDFKTGHLTLTSPRSMLLSQAIGTVIGCVVAPFTFFLFYKAFDVGNPDGEYKAPYAIIYRNMAILGVEGFSALPERSLAALLRVFRFRHIGQLVESSFS
ncbi:hypothetical protein OIU84_002133 [Salix udensis]|uniref:Uncharacterized protein n=1 Tax=Salix udensis TaxID=889485 RepID=A0AAD6K8J0_9ROSI|nr:hypothetical protein OIU84_002133 [Salix udensis]